MNCHHQFLVSLKDSSENRSKNQTMIHTHQHFDLLGKIILERVIFTPPLRLLEKLDDEACLLYSVHGNSTLYGVNTKHTLKKENSVLMKCGNYFNHWHVNKSDSRNEAVAVHLYPNVIRYIYDNNVPQFLISHSRSKPVPLQPIQNKKLIKSYIEGLLFYFENPQIVDDYLVGLKLKELLNLLYKLNSNGIREVLVDMFNPHEVDFKKTVQASLYEDLSIQELAHLTNHSLSTFKRKFKEVFSDSPASYIKTKRLEKAARLLQVSKDRISDICYDCGFNSVDNFSKSFKKAYGFSPAEFRNQSLS